MARRRHQAAVTVVLSVVGLALVTPAPSALAAGVPSAPRSVAAAPGNQQVTVTWRGPSSTGGAAINHYRVVYWRAGATTKHTVQLGDAARKLVVKPLSNGVQYYFHVAAHNRHGWGTASAKVSAVPRTIPGAPVNVRGTPTDGAIGLSWSAPASNGGASVGKYAVRMSTDGGQHWDIPAPVTDSGTNEVTTRSTTVHNLTDGTPYAYPSPYDVRHYRLEVRAHNAAGWGLWSPARLAPNAGVQMPPFAPGNVLGEASGAALRDWLTGSYWTGGYPTPAGAGDWHEGPPMQFPVDSTCGSNPAWACSNGVPQDPPPSVDFDLAAQPGDSARRTVATVTGSPRYDITYRGRVSTSEPIDVTISGAQCALTIDSTQGSSPDLTVTTQVSFVDETWATRPVASNTSVSGLENVDYELTGGILCSSGGSFFPPSTMEAQLASMVEDSLHDTFLETCGRDEPYYWMRCYPILDAVPPSPPALAATPTCPAGTPYAGPYLTLSCSGSTLVRHCASGWSDADHKISTGCEVRTAGVVPMQLGATTAQALADHASGSFFLGGYPGGVGTGSWYAAANPISIPVPLCSASGSGCPRDVGQSPKPTLTLDLGDYGEPDPRRQGFYDANTQTASVVLTGRLKTTAPLVFRYLDVNCHVTIDSTTLGAADVAVGVSVTGSGTGPLTVTGVSVSGLDDGAINENGDIDLGHRWCNYWAHSQLAAVHEAVENAVSAWAQQALALCGAPAPYYWQRCPAGS